MVPNKGNEYMRLRQRFRVVCRARMGWSLSARPTARLVKAVSIPRSGGRTAWGFWAGARPHRAGCWRSSTRVTRYGAVELSRRHRRHEFGGLRALLRGRTSPAFYVDSAAKRTAVQAVLGLGRGT